MYVYLRQRCWTMSSGDDTEGQSQSVTRPSGSGVVCGIGFVGLSPSQPSYGPLPICVLRWLAVLLFLPTCLFFNTQHNKMAWVSTSGYIICPFHYFPCDCITLCLFVQPTKRSVDEAKACQGQRCFPVWLAL
jgi:hypothetical protein